MRINKVKDSDDALVGIVVTFLIIGLIVSVLAIVQSVYIPKWMAQTESDHLDIVADQFGQLKTSIDIQSLTDQTNKPIVLLPIQTSITLGSKELPFFMTVRAYGSLNILSNASTITIQNKTYHLGTIKYSSQNAYFLDQSYIYEAGAVITSQVEGNITTYAPRFTINRSVTPNIITFRVINISGVGGKISGGGYGSIPIQTEFNSIEDNTTFLNSKYINITTLYTNAWNKTFSTLMGVTHDYKVKVIGHSVSLQLNNPTTIQMVVITINAQIGPGWIE